MLEEKISAADKSFDFCASLIFSGAETMGYIFAIPISIRRFIEKNGPYKNVSFLANNQ